MGVRYRKSVKICKGVRVNFSSSGVSYTIGGRGSSINIGPRGTYLNTSIPGTGISYRQRLDAPKQSGYSAGQTASPAPQQREIVVTMNDKGNVELFYSDGVKITSQSVISQIKSTSAYKAERKRLELERKQKITGILQQQEEESSKFTEIYRLAPKVLKPEAYEVETVFPGIPPFVRQPFPDERPNRASILPDLTQEAEGNTFSIFPWQKKKLIQRYVDDHIEARERMALEAWEDRRQRHEKAQDEAQELHKIQEAAAREQWERDMEARRKLLEGGKEFTEALIGEWFAGCTLPVDVNINYEFIQEGSLLMVDMDLPEIEDLPNEEFVKTQSGNLTKKKKTQAKLRVEYAQVVFGLLVTFSANLFNLSPHIRNITISGYTQRRNTAGDIKDTYIISVRFNRKPFERSNVAKQNPMEYCMQFENRCNMTSTMLFKEIKPFEE